MKSLLTPILLLVSSLAIGQNYWSESKNSTKMRSESVIKTSHSKAFQLDKQSFGIHFNYNKTIKVPMPDGSFKEFILTESRTMSSELKLKYPNIKVFNGISTDGKSFGNFDFTKKGFHAMIKSNNGLVFIDPINTTSSTEYQVYHKSDYINTKTALSNDDVISSENKIDISSRDGSGSSSRSSGAELRTYRMAISCTGEYTAFHGGTVEDALSAIITTLNRVNGIYEREVGIALELVGDTDLLIYTDESTDPYTNSDASAYIDEVQANIDDIIGDDNYDVGHGFSTGAGGLAGPGPCITGRKATGVTGTNSPVGDPYDVDYVAHEVGHQFGANHTFNGSTGSCSGGNRNASTAYEPGSGTTILAYAGICSPQNIQSNSDAYMHTASFDEILNYSVDSQGNSCPVITSTGNNPPSVDAGTGGYIIPIGTPFTLTGSGTDPDGHDLTFSWEQFDLGPTGDPNSPSDNAPIFRSFPPSESPVRTFPQLSDILSDAQTMGEILPSYGRSLTFRLTARDNQNGGGGVSYDEMSIDVTETAGPFLINSFNSSESIPSNSNIIIEWAVANTDQAPINCNKVNILLSVDGGSTFDYVLKSNTSNDGIEEVLLPNVTASNARIKIEASNNIFFDINNSNINIVEPTNPDFNVAVSSDLISLCSTTEEVVDIEIGSILSFSTPVDLTIEGIADGLTATLNSSTVTPGNNTSLTISNPNMTANGQYDLVVKATDGTLERSVSITLDVYDGIIEDVSILTPIDGESGLSLSTTILWEEQFGETTYQLDIATDNLFSNIVISESDLSVTTYNPVGLIENTLYYLRIKSSNDCENSDYTIHEFTTASTTCTSNASSDIPLSIDSSSPNTINSTLEIAQNGYIEDINITNLIGTHTYLGDITFTLQSPSGKTITLLNGICGDNDDFDLNLDDEAAEGNLPCPPTDGGTYQPGEELSQFKGEEASGTWTLSIIDGFNGDGGQLESWSLDICTITNNKPNPPSNLSAVINSENTGFELSWIDNSDDESGFQVERSEDNSTFVSIGQTSANTNEFFDDEIQTFTTYYYRVKAISTDDSNFSNIVEISLELLPPTAPSDLVLSAITYYDLSLNWVDNSDNENEFIVERSIGNNTNYEVIDNLEQDITNYLNTDLEVLGNYFYRVLARNKGGDSEYSNEASISTLVLSVRDEIDQSSLLYPNPFTTSFTIISDDLLDITEIKVFNSIGESIPFNWEKANNGFLIKLESYPDGIYYVSYLTDRQGIRKVIKASSK